MKRASILLATLTCGSTSNASDFNVIRGDSDTVIEMTGPILTNEYDRFMVVIKTVSGPVTLRLDSPGGKIDPALAIGHEIRNRKWTTTVKDKANCQSACALIWLAGTKRYLPQGSSIGFHQPFTPDGTVAIVGVARIGAYLNYLGYSDTTVQFVVSAPPTSMRWIQNEKEALYADIIITPAIPPVAVASGPAPLRYITPPLPWPVTITGGK